MSKSDIRKYLAKIGAVGGRKSKRVLTPEQARAMVAAKVKAKQQKGSNDPRSSN